MKNFRVWFFAFLIAGIASCQQSRAQQDSSSSNDKPVVVTDASALWHNGIEIFSAPFHFSESDLLEAGAIVGGTAALFAVDRSARLAALRNQSQTADNIFTVGREYGVSTYALSFSGALYAGGLIFRNTDVRETGLMLFESVAFSGIVTNILKSVAGRSRPFIDAGPFDFHGIQFNEETASFPSGHSTVAFAVSSVLSSRLKNNWATVSLYTLATLTAVSRVYNDEHWTSDAFLGAAIGNVIGTAVTRLHEQGKPGNAFRILPSPGGLRAEYIF